MAIPPKLRKRKLPEPPKPTDVRGTLQTKSSVVTSTTQQTTEKVDGRTLRKTGRTKQFNTRVSKDFLRDMKIIQKREGMNRVELLEHFVETYKQTKGI